MSINKRNAFAAFSITALVLLFTLSFYPSSGQASGVERISIKDVLSWEVAQGTTSESSAENSQIEELAISRHHTIRSSYPPPAKVSTSTQSPL